MKLNYPQKKNGMYYLSRYDIDTIATEYLKEYMRSVLQNAQAVDINYLAEEVCCLTVHKKRITVNKTILGLIAFGDIEIPLYDIEDNPFIENIKEGTIVIDSILDQKVYRDRYRFTLAHEVGHWLLHRSYHSPDNQNFQLRSIGNNHESFIACKSNSIESTGKTFTTDEDWEEWQADCMAAALLMPADVFYYAAKEAMKEIGVDKLYIYSDSPSPSYSEILVKQELSRKFRVSFTAVHIRLMQFGLLRPYVSRI